MQRAWVTHVGSLIAISVSVNPLWAQKSWICGFSCSDSDPSGSYNLFFASSTGFPKLCPVFGCGFLNLHFSVAGWSLSEEDYARFQLPIGVISLIFFSQIMFYSILGLWALHALSPELPDNVGALSNVQ